MGGSTIVVCALAPALLLSQGKAVGAEEYWVTHEVHVTDECPSGELVDVEDHELKELGPGKYHDTRPRVYWVVEARDTSGDPEFMILFGPDPLAPTAVGKASIEDRDVGGTTRKTFVVNAGVGYFYGAGTEPYGGSDGGSGMGDGHTTQNAAIALIPDYQPTPDRFVNLEGMLRVHGAGTTRDAQVNQYIRINNDGSFPASAADDVADLPPVAVLRQRLGRILMLVTTAEIPRPVPY